ncbi:MAG: hypothetical protein V1776_03000 [Candidatus Diapherotrites archaeon]
MPKADRSRTIVVALIFFIVFIASIMLGGLIDTPQGFASRFLGGGAENSNVQAAVLFKVEGMSITEAIPYSKTTNIYTIEQATEIVEEAAKKGELVAMTCGYHNESIKCLEMQEIFAEKLPQAIITEIKESLPGG